jgi:hypothetical protein
VAGTRQTLIQSKVKVNNFSRVCNFSRVLDTISRHDFLHRLKPKAANTNVLLGPVLREEVNLATKGNKLSVYLVDDDHKNLEQIVTALAAACDYISDFEFSLFAEGALHETSIKGEETAGDTPDPLSILGTVILPNLQRIK